MMNFSESPEFKKEVKNFAKKWRSIPDDIVAAKQYIMPLYVQMDDGVDINQYRQAFFNGKNAAIIFSNSETEVIKMRLDVAYLNRNDKVRLIFIAIRSKDEILFIELYAKNDKPREDQSRIKRYTK